MPEHPGKKKGRATAVPAKKKRKKKKKEEQTSHGSHLTGKVNPNIAKRAGHLPRKRGKK